MEIDLPSTPPLAQTSAQAVTLNYATPAVCQFATQPAYSRILCQWDEDVLRLTELPDGRNRIAHWIVGLPLIIIAAGVLLFGLFAPAGWFANNLHLAIFCVLAIVGGALAIAEVEAQRRWPMMIEVYSNCLIISRPTILMPTKRWQLNQIRGLRADPAGLEVHTLRPLASLTVLERFLWRRIRVMTRRSEECKWIAALVNAAIAAQRNPTPE